MCSRSAPEQKVRPAGIGALNFLLHDALGGGGIASLRNDPQGKALAQQLLEFPVPVTQDIARSVARGD